MKVYLVVNPSIEDKQVYDNLTAYSEAYSYLL